MNISNLFHKIIPVGGRYYKDSTQNAGSLQSPIKRKYPQYKPESLGLETLKQFLGVGNRPSAFRETIEHPTEAVNQYVQNKENNWINRRIAEGRRPPNTAELAPLNIAGGIVGATAEIPHQIAQSPFKIAKTLRPSTMMTKEHIPGVGNVTSYLQDYYNRKNQLLRQGLDKRTATLASVLGAGSSALMDVSILGGLIDSGARTLANGITPTLDQKIGAWKVLGEPKTPEEVRVNYQQLAHQFHPDLGGDPEAMGIINKAHNILTKGGLPSQGNLAGLKVANVLKIGGQKAINPISRIMDLPKYSLSLPQTTFKKLPGYAEENPQPAMGLSIKKVKKVGFTPEEQSFAKKAIQEASSPAIEKVRPVEKLDEVILIKLGHKDWIGKAVPKQDYINALKQVGEKTKLVSPKAKIPKELELLAKEARKYKNAEEFVRTQKRAFHGSPVKGLKEIGFGEGVRTRTFLGKTEKVKSGAIFFTPDKKIAKFFADNRVEWLKSLGKKGEANVYERYLNIRNPIDLTGKNIKQTSKILRKANIDIEEAMGLTEFGQGLETLLRNKDIEISDLWRIVDNPKNVEKLKKIGIDGAIFKETGNRGISYAIFNPKQAFTKQQLIDFYNQAIKGVNQPTPTESKAPKMTKPVEEVKTERPIQQSLINRPNKSIIPYVKQLPTGEPLLESHQTNKITAINRLRSELAQSQGKLSIGRVKQELVNYARKNVPLPVRGKLLAQVKNVKDVKGLKNAINLADKYSSQYIGKELQAKIINELKETKAKVREGILRGKYTADVQEKLNKIYAQAIAGSRAEAQEKIAENIEKYNEGKIGYDDMVKQNEILSMADIKHMSPRELQRTLDNIISIKNTGRTLRALKDFNDQTRIQRLKDKFVDILTGNKGIKKGAVSLPRQSLEYGEKGKIGKIRKAWNKIQNWQFGWDNILDNISRYDKTSKPYHSLISRFGSNVHVSRDLQDKGESSYLAEVQKSAMKIFHTSNRGALGRILGRMKNEQVHLGTFKNLDGDPVQLDLTKGQIIHIYNEMRDPTLEDTFRDGLRWTDKMKEAVVKSLTPEEKAWADWQRDFYQKYYDTINPVYRDIYGIDLPKNPNYVPIGRDIEANLPEDVLMAKDAIRYASVINGSLKSRARTKMPLKFNDTNDVLVNHIIRMEHFKAWAKAMKDLRRVFGDKDIRTAIRQYHGADTLKTIDGYLNDMARDGVDRAKIVHGVDVLRRNFTKAILGLKPSIAVKQIGSVLAYSTEMPLRDFVTGIDDFWAHPVQNYRFLLEHSPYIQKRFGAGFERDIKFAMKKGYASQIANANNVSDWLMWMIRQGDKFAVVQGSWAKYKSALKEGLSIEDAMKEAEEATRRTQPSFNLETLSSLQKGGSWMKLFTMFQNQPNKYFRIIADNARNMYFGRANKGKAIYNIILAWAILPSIFQFMADAFHFRKKHQIRAAVLGPINDFLVAGQLAQSIYGWLTNEPFDYTASPVFASTKELQYAITKTAKNVHSTDKVTLDDWIKATEHYGKAVGELTGYPTPYLVQAEKGLRRGKPEELLFSHYSLEGPKKKKTTTNWADTLKPKGSGGRRKSKVDWEKVFSKKSKNKVDWKKVFAK